MFSWRTYVIKEFKHLFTAVIIGLLLCSFLSNGCKRNDIALVTRSPIGNRETTIEKAFNKDSIFLSTVWSQTEDKNRNSVVLFTGEISKDKLLENAAKDSANWLRVERGYFESVKESVKRAYIRVSFPIAPDKTFKVGDITLGISSQTHTAWSPVFNTKEKELVIEEIYKHSQTLYEVISHYADPSKREGSGLYFRLTGIDLRKLI